LSESGELGSRLIGGHHTQHDLSPCLPKHLPFAAESVKRRRHVAQPLLHLGYEFRILHVAPSKAFGTAFRYRKGQISYPKRKTDKSKSFALA
jgi:hypothetical protein